MIAAGGAVASGSGGGPLNPMNVFELVYDSAGLVGTVGGAPSSWVPTKGTGTLTEADTGAPIVTTFKGHKAARSNGGRLANKANSPSISAVGDKMTFALAGVIPAVATSAFAGITGSAYGSGSKPFPFFIENTAGTYAWRLGSAPSAAQRDTLANNINSWVGKSFFAIVRQAGSGSADYSRLDIYIDGTKQQFIAATKNVATVARLGGLTLLGFEDSNGNYEAPFAYFAAMGGWPTDGQVSSMLDWALDEYTLDDPFTGIVYEIDADHVLLSGSNVTTVLDQGGAGNNWGVNTVSPPYVGPTVSTWRNGLKAFDVNGTNLQISSFTGGNVPQPFTAYVVGEWPTNADGGRLIATLGGSSSSTPSMPRQIYGWGPFRIMLNGGSSDQLAVPDVTGASGVNAPPQGQPYIMVVSFDGAATKTKIYALDGTLKTGTVPASAGTAAATGGWASPAGTNKKIAAMGLYYGASSDAQMLAKIDQLKLKYGF